MRIVVANTLVPFVRGGAEDSADRLVAALRAAGHEVQPVAVPFRWYPAEETLNHMLACGLLDVTVWQGGDVDLFIGLRFPAYLMPHPRKRIWLYHEYRAAYSLWGHPVGDLAADPMGACIREAIVAADRKAFGACMGVYSISRNVALRLEHHLGVRAEVLYHPPDDAEKFRCGEDGGYWYFPSRICGYKRQALALEAVAAVPGARLVFSGMPDTPGALDALLRRVEELGVEDRVRWVGHVSAEQKLALYAGARGVLFPPLDEDYGFVTLEGMLASKPVITCADSGGPLEFIRDGEEGLVVEASEEALAGAVARLEGDPGLAARMGRAGRARYEEMGIGWERVLGALAAGV